MFKDSAGKIRWFTVLKNLEVGEIMVPYDKMEPVFLDVSRHAFASFPPSRSTWPGVRAARRDSRFHRSTLEGKGAQGSPRRRPALDERQQQCPPRREKC